MAGGAAAARLYREGLVVIRRPSPGAAFGVGRPSARERLPLFEALRGAVRGGRFPDGWLRHASRSFSDGWWPETDLCRWWSQVTEPASQVGDLHEHTVKRSAFATIPAETRPFIIITTHPSLLLVALPCDSWLQEFATPDTQLRIQAPRVGAPASRDAVDATHP